MKLCIKVGSDAYSINDLQKTQAQFAEVWFRIDLLDQYTELFNYLTNNHIETGLHFWGLTRNNSTTQ